MDSRLAHDDAVEYVELDVRLACLGHYTTGGVTERVVVSWRSNNQLAIQTVETVSTEDSLHALVRELNEELTIRVTAIAQPAVARAAAAPGEGERAIVIHLYTIDAWDGTPQPEPGAELGWFAAEEIARLRLPPLDSQLAAQLFARPG